MHLVDEEHAGHKLGHTLIDVLVDHLARAAEKGRINIFLALAPAGIAINCSRVAVVVPNKIPPTNCCEL